MPRELNVTLCSDRCPATKEKWRCERCSELIGDTFDIMVANGGGIRVPMTDLFIEDFQFRKRYGKDLDKDKALSSFADLEALRSVSPQVSREALLSEAADGCKHHALIIEVDW